MKMAWKTLAISLVFLVGCETDDPIQNPPQVAPSLQKIEAFFDENKPELQDFTLLGSSYQEVRGESGTVIAIPPNAFVDQSGIPVTGNFTFELKEVYTPGDMIFEEKWTTSGGNILTSGGELYINANLNGEQLILADDKELSIMVPTDNPDPQMELFVGVGEGDNFDWVQDSTDVSECVDSNSLGNSSYCFEIDSLINWINCDYFRNDPRPLTDVEIVVPSGYDTQNTLVVIYIPSLNSVVPVYTYQNGSFYVNGGYQLPVGLAVTFVSVHYDGNDFYYALQNNTIVNNHVETLNFQMVTQAQLTTIIQSL